MSRIRRTLVVALLCLPYPGGGPAMAQAVRDTLGRVGGVIFDSVAMRPAAGALVQLVPREVTSGATYSTTADARGRFELGGLAAGSYLIGFYFFGTDTLNIQLPPIEVTVRAGERTRADLAVPPPRRIVAAICSASGADSIGAIVGFLRDARNDLPLDSGVVTAAWSVISIGAGGLRFEPGKAEARVSQGGSFVLCGVDAGGEVVLVAASGADTSGAIIVRIPDHGLLRRDVSVGGTVNVRGVVLTDVGRPAPNAEVLLAGRERPVLTDSAGVFRVVGARAGTQTLEARALGYVPERRAVTLAGGRDTSLQIRLTSLKKLLDTIQVVAERVYWADRSGFRQRQRSGNGRYFDREAIRKRNPFDIYSLLQTIPGIQISRSGVDEYLTMRGGIGRCTPSLYVDGVMLPTDLLADLRFLVPIEQIGALEVYSSSAGLPAQFANMNRCGAIVVWTLAPLPRKRR